MSDQPGSVHDPRVTVPWWDRRLGLAPVRAVVLSAGGVASTVLAYWLARRRCHITIVSCDLGVQIRGVLAAATVAGRLRCEHRVADLSAFTRALTHDTTGPPGDPPSPPRRVANALPLMIELGVTAAAHRGGAAVLIGVHGDDVFLDPAALHDRDRVRAPLVGLNIAEVVQVGIDLRVPLADTRSCYRDDPTHCGDCTGCRRRRGAFAAADIADPTAYLHDDGIGG